MKKIIFFLLFIFYSINCYSQNIVEYEYWINDNYNNKIVKTITAAPIANIVADLDIPNAEKGYNIFNIRFKDSNGKYSSTTSHFFFYSGGSSEKIDNIVAYEYWLDNKYSTRKIELLEGASNITSFLDFGEINNGFHLISFRFKTATGIYSSTTSCFFFKAGDGASEENLIVGYRYWFDDNIEQAQVVNLDTPRKLCEISSTVQLQETNFLSIHFQFLDTAGLWSSVYTKLFTPEANFEIFSTINTFSFQNTTDFGETYTWDFGDGSVLSKEVNPSHTYKNPGVYDIVLVATNKLGKDTVSKQVIVEGIREVVSNKAGNTGDATLYIYGGGFTKNTIVYLEDEVGNRIDAEKVSLWKMDALTAKFNLRQKKIGVYSVFVEFNSQKYKLDKAFTIEQGSMPAPYVSISGRDKILFGRWQTYTLNFGNRGNVDATGVPLILITSEPDGFDIEFPELVLNQNTMLKEHNNYDEVKNFPNYYKTDNLFGKSFNGRVYALYIPVIPANFNMSMQIRIKSDKNIELYSWVSEPYFQSPIDKKIEECIRAAMLKAIKDGLVDIGLNNLPVIGCINSFWNQYLEPNMWESVVPEADPSYKNRQKSWKETFFSWGNSALDLSVLVLNCAKDFVGPLKAWSVSIQIINLLNNIKGNYLIDKECREKYKPISQENKNIAAVASFDPNELVGPQGVTSENYTVNNRDYSYTIYFENMKTASAPAQEVIVRDTLDKTKFDFSSFSFGSVKFGNHRVAPLPGLKQFTIDYDLAPERPNIVRINARFDEITGEVLWQFITLDTNTMDLTEDPEGGFLPPNINSPDGEGSVQFSVQLKKNLPNNEKIENRANIYFDLNAPILTNLYSNRIDIAPPESKLNNIYYTSNPKLFRIAGVSDDAQSKVSRILVYAKINSGEFFPILTTSDDEFYIELDRDSTYYFFSQAIDNVGNIEPLKSNFEVSTLNVGVDELQIGRMFDFSITPNPADNFVELMFSLESPENIEISIYDINGKNKFYKQINSTSGMIKEQVDLYNYVSGPYIIQVRIANKNIIKLLNVVK